MRVVSRAKLKAFWDNAKYSDAEQPLKSWYDEAKKAHWRSPQDIKDKYRNASFIANNRVVFTTVGNCHANSYRLIVAIKYEFGICYIRFVGTHRQYDKIDAEVIF